MNVFCLMNPALFSLIPALPPSRREGGRVGMSEKSTEFIRQKTFIPVYLRLDYLIKD